MLARTSNPSARRKIVIGNWKMCRDLDRLSEIEPLAAAAQNVDLDVVLCPPFPLIPLARPAEHVRLKIGAQDCHHEVEGPHTGCVSPAMLRALGVTHVIVGHSERRTACGESDAIVCAKAAAATRAGLIAIVCVGESADERAAGIAEAVIADQIEQSIPASARPDELMIAYEPIWAIGSGATPTAEEITDVHRSIRAALRRTLGPQHAAETRILYGGSVTAANAGWVLDSDDVDGLLVGSASLTASSFIPIIEAAAAARTVHAAAA
jgi:triosephosphate isomerase